MKLFTRIFCVLSTLTIITTSTSVFSAETDTTTTNTSVIASDAVASEDKQSAATTTKNASNLPKSFSNQYLSSLLGFKVTVTHELKPLADGTLEMHFRAESWFASIDEVSHLRIDEQTSQVIPLHYRYKRRGAGRKRDAELTFNWDTKTVTNNVQDTTWKMGIVEHVQDKLSYQLQLQHDLYNGKDNFSYQIADGGRLKEYAFEIVAEETLKTPLGEVATIKVKRSRDTDERITYAWLAKDHNYLLVRMEQEEKGDTYTINLNTAKVDDKVIKAFN